MTDGWLAALGALFVWWFATGAILCAVRLAERRGAYLALTAGTLPLAALGLALAGSPSPWLGFLAAIAVWGWLELAFMTGVIAGPSRAEWSGGGEWARFRAAFGVLAWHELALVAAGAAIWAVAGYGTAFLTFAVLWAARVSAKLNLFWGVPRINVEFLPRPLAHLQSHFRQGPVSWLFPVSILLLSLAAFCWLERWAVTGDVRFALLSALTLLALLEHWLMVLPLPDAKLWRWAIPARPTNDQLEGEK